MLQLYDVNKNKIKGLTAYKDYCIESVLKTGDKTLSFLYPKKLGKEIKNEGYIRNKTDEFVIKSIDTQDDWLTINASLNVEDLEGKEWESFIALEQTIEQCLNLACVGTGWTVSVTGVTKKRIIRMTNCNSWDIIQQARKTYLVEYKFDTINKIIIIKEKQGQDKGTYFTEDLNLKKLDINNDSYDFFTRIKPIGKNNLKISVNGKDYLENYQYSNKAKTLIWKDERYTVVASLIEDATIKLNELSKPRVAYAVEIIDLAKLSSKYKNILDYSLGDTIYLVSKENNVREKQRIVKTKEYPDEAERNSCEIANTIFTFEDIQKEYSDTVDTVDNITSDNGTVSEGAIRGAVESIIINKANITELNAAVARIGSLESTKANITDLTAINANISNLQVNKANITDLTATNIKFDVGEGGTLSLQTLLAKFVTGENGQYLNLTSSNVVIANAVIKDTIAANISVQDLKAGNIDANRFNIVGTNGNLLIKDNTIQIKDSTRVRVQIGKDASNDYNMYVWDATGKLMFDATGLKADGIKSKIIRDDMVSDTANISGTKINISSLITEVNKDTNTQTIKGSKVTLDTTGQSLEVSFNSLKTSSDDIKSKTESNTTSIGTINGQIDTLIKDTTIEENGSTIKLKDSYSSLKQTVNGINTTVASHTTSITTINTNVINAQNTANSANTLADSKAKVFTATPTTPYKVGDIWTGGPSGELMKCKVARASGTYTASDWEKASKYTDDTKANAVEGNLNTLSGKVTTVENNYTSLNQDLSGFKTTVASTYSTKTELSTVDGKISSLTSRVSTAESSITQLNNKIALKVEATDVTTAINAIQISARNYVRKLGGDNYDLTYTYSTDKNYCTVETISNKKWIKFTGATTLRIASIIIEPNTEYTWSFSVYTTGTDTSISCSQYFSGSYGHKNHTIGITPTRISHTFTSKDTATTEILHIGGLVAGDVYYFADFTFVKGNKGISDWSPSPEDVDSAIAIVDGRVTTLNTSLTTTNNKVATIETNLNSITSRVASTESSISTINGNVSSITTRVNTVEQSITATALTTTISSTINAGTSNISTTQFVMDKNGLTIKNGSIKIQNKAGNTVLTGDTDGNLYVQNSLIVGGNTNGNIQVKNASSVNIFSANKNGIFLKDGLMKVTSGNVNWDGITYPEGETKEMTVYANGIRITQKDYTGSQEYINKADYLYNQMKIVEDNRSNALGTYFETTVTASSIQTSGTITAIGNLVIGSSMQYPTLPATKTLITLYPPYHTGGPWYLKGNDVSEKAYLDLNYGNNLKARIDSDGIFLVDRLRGVVGDNFSVGSKNARIDATDGLMRLYTSASGTNDNGIQISLDGAVTVKCNSVNRHIFFAGGTKTGGTMEVEGIVYGMSPTDSPQTLIEYIIPNVLVEGEVRIELDSIYIKMISYYVAFLSNKNIEIKEKGLNYIIVEGNGITDILIKGQRKDAEDYYRIMGGFTHGSETEVSY